MSYNHKLYNIIIELLLVIYWYLMIYHGSKTLIFSKRCPRYMFPIKTFKKNKRCLYFTDIFLGIIFTILLFSNASENSEFDSLVNIIIAWLFSILYFFSIIFIEARRNIYQSEIKLYYFHFFVSIIAVSLIINTIAFQISIIS